MRLLELVSEVWQILRESPRHSWLAIVTSFLAGASLLLSSWWLAAAAFVLACSFTSAVFVADPESGSPLSAAFKVTPLVLVSMLLVWLVLFFLGVLTLLAAGLGAFAIMTGSGFDFEAASQSQEAFEAVLTTYQATPGWQLAMAVFLVALALFFAAVARSLPFSTGSAIEGRILALEAFNWTRRHGAKLLLVVVVFCGFPLLLAVWGAEQVGNGAKPFVRSLSAGAGVYLWNVLSLATYRLLRPGPSQIDGPD